MDRSKSEPKLLFLRVEDVAEDKVAAYFPGIPPSSGLQREKKHSLFSLSALGGGGEKRSRTTSSTTAPVLPVYSPPKKKSSAWKKFKMWATNNSEDQRKRHVSSTGDIRMYRKHTTSSATPRNQRTKGSKESLDDDEEDSVKVPWSPKSTCDADDERGRRLASAWVINTPDFTTTRLTTTNGEWTGHRSNRTLFEEKRRRRRGRGAMTSEGGVRSSSTGGLTTDDDSWTEDDERSDTDM